MPFDPSVSFGRFRNPLLAMLVLGLAVRLVLMPLLTFQLDFSYWLRITDMLDSGFGLYDTTGYYYTPIWGYIVALFSFIGEAMGMTDLGTFVPDLTAYSTGVYTISDYVVSPLYAVVLKVPIVIADVVTAFLLYDLVKDITCDERKALMAFGLWFLCPFIIVVSSVHGMFDCMSAMLILLTFTFVRKRRYFLGGAAFALSVLTKFFPVFLIFFLVAYVVRKEGLDRKGAGCVGVAVLGALVATVVIELPMIVRGQFWESLNFLTNRLGLSASTMYSLTSPKMLLIGAVGMCVLIAIGYWFFTRRYPALRERVLSMSHDQIERAVRRGLLYLTIVASLAVVVYSVISTLSDTSDSTLVDILSALGMKAVMLLSVYTLILEMYLAYRLLITDRTDDRSVYRILMLSSLAIFLWPPLPHYVVVIVPFLILYAVAVDEGFLRPFGLFALVMLVYELVGGNGSMLFTLAVYGGMFPLSIPIALTEVVTFDVLGFPLMVVLLAVLVVLEYVTMFGMLRSWYEGREVRAVEG